MVDIRNPLPCEKAVSYLAELFRGSRDPISEAITAACGQAALAYAAAPAFPYESRTKKQGPFKTWEIPFYQYRLNVACLLADNLRAEAETVIASLLGPGLKTMKLFRNTLEPVIGASAYDRIILALKPVPNTFSDLNQAAAAVDELLWDCALDRQRQLLERKARKNKTPQIYYITQAYELAKRAHQGVCRQSGEPYLSHPLEVAGILVDRGAESEVVAAALLHDVIEDSEEEPRQSRRKIKEISPQIARYVEAVTSVDREYQAYAEQKKARGEAFTPMDKEALDRATVNKLLTLSREDESMIRAVYIKAADRYHNLLTIDGMPYDKIRKKLDETDEYYLPLFRAFGVNEFVPAIEDQLWRAGNPAAYGRVSAAFEKLLGINKENLQRTQAFLRDIVDEQIGRKCEELLVPGYAVDLREETIYPYQVFKTVEDSGAEDICASITKNRVPLLSYSVVGSGDGGRSDLNLFASVFIKTLEDGTEDLRHVITKLWMEPIAEAFPDHMRFAIELENEMASRIVIRLYEQDDYYLYKNGSLDGMAAPERDEDIEMLGGSIKVHDKDNVLVSLPRGATVLDFAFAIHADVGYTAAAASINDRPPTADALRHILRDRDKVVIYNGEGKVGGYGKPQVDWEWLKIVQTKYARDSVIKWLQRKYEQPKEN